MISVNGDSVLDTLKQHSQAALLLNSGISGLGTSSLPFPSSTSTSTNPLSPILQGVQGIPNGVNNAFVAPSFQPVTAGTNILPTQPLDTNDRRPTAVQSGEGLTTTPVPLQTNNNTLKSPSSCSSSKIRQAAAPYTAKHV